MGPSKCRVEEVHLKHNSFAANPVVVSFKNGAMHADVDDEDLKFSFFQPKAAATETNTILMAETKDVIYTQTNVDLDECNYSKNKWCIGLLDKETGKMRIFESSLGYLNLKAAWKDETATNESTAISKVLYQEKSKSLTLAFGSKKKRGVISSRDRQNVDVQELVPAMEQTALKVELSTIDEKIKQISSIPTLITINWDATKLEKVYDLEEIVSSTVLDTLDDAVSEFANANQEKIKTWQTKSEYPRFVLKVLQYMKQPRSTHTLKLLLYLTYMLDMYDLKAHDIRKIEPFARIMPPEVKSNLMDTYFQSASNSSRKINRSFPAHLRDKLLAHIIVIAFMVNHWKVDFADIPSIKISLDKLHRIGRVIGAHPDKSSKVLCLKLPLKKFVDGKKKMTRRK